MNKERVAITKKGQTQTDYAQLFDPAALKLSDFFVDERDPYWRGLC
jgi:hypothetical protein